MVLLVAADVLLAIFAKSFYGDWIFFGIFILVCLLVSLINNAGISRAKEAILNTLIPLLLIAFIYCTYTLFLPNRIKYMKSEANKFMNMVCRSKK